MFGMFSMQIFLLSKGYTVINSLLTDLSQMISHKNESDIILQNLNESIIILEHKDHLHAKSQMDVEKSEADVENPPKLHSENEVNFKYINNMFLK